MEKTTYIAGDSSAVSAISVLPWWDSITTPVGEDSRFRGHDQPSGWTSSLRTTRYSVACLSYRPLSSASNKIPGIRRFSSFVVTT